MARVTSHHLKRMSASRSCNLRAVACLRQATRSEKPSVPPPNHYRSDKGLRTPLAPFCSTWV